MLVLWAPAVAAARAVCIAQPLLDAERIGQVAPCAVAGRTGRVAGQVVGAGHTAPAVHMGVQHMGVQHMAVQHKAVQENPNG